MVYTHRNCAQQHTRLNALKAKSMKVYKYVYKNLKKKKLFICFPTFVQFRLRRHIFLKNFMSFLFFLFLYYSTSLFLSLSNFLVFHHLYFHHLLLSCFIFLFCQIKCFLYFLLYI